MAETIFVYRFAVRLHDTDAAGVLFFAHLLRHAHDAYEAFMADLGFPLPGLVAGTADALPVHLPIVRTEGHFRAPMRHGDLIRVEVQPNAVRGRSFAIGYRFLREDEAGVRECARAETVHCRIGPEGGPETALPEPLAAALRARMGPPPA